PGHGFLFLCLFGGPDIELGNLAEHMEHGSRNGKGDVFGELRPPPFALMVRGDQSCGGFLLFWNNLGDVDFATSGLTQRGGRTRPGLDRWHYLNGSIRVRQRERLRREAGDQQPPPIPEDATISFQMSNDEAQMDRQEVTAESFYGMKSQAWNNANHMDGNSTTAGENETVWEPTSEHSSTENYTGQEIPHDAGQSPESEGDGAGETTGFWKHGVWQPRPRTEQEMRQHRGGNGPRRQQRRQGRMLKYFNGEWKPAWLEEYKKQKMAREAMRATYAGVIVEEEVNADVGETAEEDVNIAASSSSTTNHLATNLDVPQETQQPLIQQMEENAKDEEDETDSMAMMQLRNAEIARLQEQGVPRQTIAQLENFMNQLHARQEYEGIGPESRWAIARMLRRGIEAEQAFEAILD
ncbi:C28H8.4, partial [Symbiodinium sp. CCMP2456]